jgi:hypothetical protein
MTNIIVDLIIAIVLGGLGIYLIKSNGKESILLAGYNLATDEQRKCVDEKKLCAYSGKHYLVGAILFLFGTIVDAFYPTKGF